MKHRKDSQDDHVRSKGRLQFALPATIIALLDKQGLLRRFGSDQSGSYAIIISLVMPVLVGIAGLGTEAGWWLYSHKNMLSAADSAAISAATISPISTDLTNEANAVTAAYGYVNGVKGVTVAIHQPPLSGNYTATSSAVEVVISQPQARLLSSLFGSEPVVISARAVAVTKPGRSCVLALSRTANPAVAVTGTADLNLLGCGLYANSAGSSAVSVDGTAHISATQVSAGGGVSGSGITAPGGIQTGVPWLSDPYQNVSIPPSLPPCNSTPVRVNSSATLTAGRYCGGITVNAGATLNLDKGIYYIDGNGLDLKGNGTITGTDVTLVFTGSTASGWATASIASNAIVNLTAPATGTFAGIVLYGDRNMPVDTVFKLTGGAAQELGGAIYLPEAALEFAGGNSTQTSCTRIIANTVSLVGNTDVKVDCSGFGGQLLGDATAQLVE